jgi:hypothetical protein
MFIQTRPTIHKFKFKSYIIYNIQLENIFNLLQTYFF